MTASTEFPMYPFVRAKSYTSGRKPGQPSVVFIHTTEGSEGTPSAENGAAYDQRRTDGTSTHFFVDQDSTIQCVLVRDEAHAARSHGNDVGIQIEVCGRAGQTAAQWADAASAGAIEQCARLIVEIRNKYGAARFPLVNLTPAQLRAGQHGFAEHLDATKAWPEDGGTHWDPGPNFPWATVFARVKKLEAAEMRTLVWQAVEGKLPIIKFGDQDGEYANSGTSWVRRIQRQLEIDVDGDYGNATVAAVKALGINDGKTVDMRVWEKLFGLWGASDALKG
jgi:N-acetyl-anhydromuramyl-L-alanine amidase AmpD